MIEKKTKKERENDVPSWTLWFVRKPSKNVKVKRND
jgi:hypothetical protein